VDDFGTQRHPAVLDPASAPATPAAAGEPAGEWPKADVLHRLIAKFVDLLIVAALVRLLPPVGFFAGITYLLIADGVWAGQSIGKRIVGLRALQLADGRAASFRESILRNAPLAAGMFGALIPYIGIVLLIVVLVFEALLVLGNERGLRIGDELAATQVVAARPVAGSRVGTSETEDAG
jgi:uncharacterized RDD family membrane protein YckC